MERRPSKTARLDTTRMSAAWHSDKSPHRRVRRVVSHEANHNRALIPRPVCSGVGACTAVVGLAGGGSVCRGYTIRRKAIATCSDQFQAVCWQGERLAVRSSRLDGIACISKQKVTRNVLVGVAFELRPIVAGREDHCPNRANHDDPAVSCFIPSHR